MATKPAINDFLGRQSAHASTAEDPEFIYKDSGPSFLLQRMTTVRVRQYYNKACAPVDGM